MNPLGHDHKHGPSDPDDDLAALYAQVIEFYIHQAKVLIVASEKADEKQRLNVSAIMEIRAAFDHAMRAHAVQYGIIDPHTIESDTGLEATDYCRENLQRSLAHLYRAAWDSYDLIIVNLMSEIQEMLDKVSQITLFRVIPDAAEKILLPFDEARQIVTTAKLDRDWCEAAAMRSMYDDYERAAGILVKIRDLLRSNMTHLEQYEHRPRGWRFPWLSSGKAGRDG